MAVLVFLSACQAEATQTPEPTLTPALPTPEPSATIDWFPRTPTATPQIPVTPRPSQATRTTPIAANLIVADDFSDKELWQTSTSSAGTVAYETDALSLALASGKNTLTSLSSHELPPDFYLEINLDALMCSPEDQFGLILWNNSSSGTFRLWFSCSGQVMLDRVLPSGITVLQKWQIARKFQIGSPAKNRIGVRSQNGSLEVFVNQTQQFSYSPLREISGALGVIAQNSSEHALTVRVSDLEISNP